MSTIELKNVGPISHLSIPIPEDGGIVVLKGRNGLGKTHAIEAVEALYDKDVRKELRPRDGSTLGTIEGLGVTIRLGRMNTSKGELVCEHLDGKLDPSRLVDPGIKDPVAADSRRLAAVIQLAGIRVKRDSWEQSLGEHFAEIDPTGIDEDYPVDTAGNLRRQLHTLAVLHEKAAATSSAKADACKVLFAGVDLENTADQATLSAELARTVEHMVALEKQVESYNSHEKWRSETQWQLEELRSELGDRDQLQRADVLAKREVQELEHDLKRVTSELAELEEKIQVLHQQNRELSARLTAAKTIESKTAADVLSLNARKERLKSLEASLNGPQPTPPEPGEMEKLAAKKQTILSQIEQASHAKKAIEAKQSYDTFKAQADESTQVATSLRELAKSTDTVLQKALHAAGFASIAVEEGRLCVKSDRGMEPFSELSQGERWKIALDLAAQGLPRGAVLPVRQDAFESLDPLNRLEIYKMAKERGLVIITAESDEGDLRAEEF